VRFQLYFPIRCYAPRKPVKFRIITVRNRPGPGFSDTGKSNILKTSWPSAASYIPTHCSMFGSYPQGDYRLHITALHIVRIKLSQLEPNLFFSSETCSANPMNASANRIPSKNNNIICLKCVGRFLCFGLWRLHAMFVLLNAFR